MSTCRGKQASEAHFTKGTENLKLLFKRWVFIFQQLHYNSCYIAPQKRPSKNMPPFQIICSDNSNTDFSNCNSSVVKLPNHFAISIKPRVTRSPKPRSKLYWISETWYDHEGQSGRRPLGESWSSFLQGEDAGPSRLTQKQHLPPILCGQPQLLLPDSIATVNRWDLIYSLLKKAITCQSVLAFSPPWQFFPGSIQGSWTYRLHQESQMAPEKEQVMRLDRVILPFLLLLDF